jgi:lysozyme
MDWLQLALPLVRKWEGCKLSAYLCPANVWTCGYGSTGPDVTQGVKWTQAQAEARLERDLRGFGSRVDALVLVDLSAPQMAALASLAYNIGINAFRASTLLRKLNAGDTSGAAREFDKWTRGGGRVLPGLVKRRADERALFEGHG